MNAYERMMGRIEGRPVDRIPNMNIVMLFAARETGHHYGQVVRNGRLLAEGMLRCYERYGIDCLWTISDSVREPGDVGAEVIVPEKGVPYCPVPFIRDAEDFARLKLIQPWEGPAMSDRIESVRILKAEAGSEAPVVGWVEGAFAAACNFMDVQPFMAFMMEEPEAARELLDHPADGYHPEWDADAWLKIKGREEEFDAEPEDVLKLFESLVGRCGDPIPRKDHPDFYKVWLSSVRDKLASAWDCPLCAWKRNTSAFCEGCGAKREDIPSGRAVSAPKPKPPVPWSCRCCGTVGNSGSYCCECGAPINAEERFIHESGPIGYRRGRGTGGFLRMLPNGMVPAPQPAPQSPPQTPPSAGAPAPGEWFCTQCGARNSGKFCTECGKPKEQ